MYWSCNRSANNQTHNNCASAKLAYLFLGCDVKGLLFFYSIIRLWSLFISSNHCLHHTLLVSNLSKCNSPIDDYRAQLDVWKVFTDNLRHVSQSYVWLIYLLSNLVAILFIINSTKMNYKWTIKLYFFLIYNKNHNWVLISAP